MSQSPDVSSHTSIPKIRKRRTVFEILRLRFIAGLITIIPAAFTIWFILLLVGILDANVGRHIEPRIHDLLVVLGAPVTVAKPVTLGVSLILAFGVILIVGMMTRFLLIRRLITFGESLVTRIPFIRFFYLTPKEVISILTSDRDQVKRVVLIEYPRKDVWAFAYATSETIHQPDGQTMVAVFMPSTPNPTTGFMMLLPTDQVLDINMSTENAMRMIISGGILSPNHYHTKPFAGMTQTPDLPTPEPLTSELPPEIREQNEN